MTIEKLIKNLKQAFDKKNKKIKLINKMFNFNFRINFKNKNKIFDEFLIRFNNLTVLLRLNHIIKIKYFRNKLTKKMRYRMSHFKNCKNWNNFVENWKKMYENNENLKKYKFTKSFKKSIKKNQSFKKNVHVRVFVRASNSLTN